MGSLKQTVPLKQVELSEDEFHNKFNPIKNHISENSSFDGCMFETYGKDLKFVKKQVQEKRLQIWTITDDGEDVLTYQSGFHYVNRMGYFLTLEHIEASTEVFVCIDITIDN